MPALTDKLLGREKRISSNIEKYSKLFEIDPNLVRALITQESAFIPDATSPTGAYGYGQFTGIGAKQVYRDIAQMNEDAADLASFTKNQASDPDVGIKAICAYLWWLYHVKYANVKDKAVRLEASLTFYNAGGNPAVLVVRHGGHKNALPFIQQLPKNMRGQSEKYAPQVAAWFLKWHGYYKKEEDVVTPPPVEVALPTGDVNELSAKHNALVAILKWVGSTDNDVDVFTNSRDGLTEVTIILPGEN